MDLLLEVSNLVKEYPGVRAVNGVSFGLRAGRCFGLLGPNGAGKTTTVEILEGITPPTSGRILYRGEPVGERFRCEAGIMFQRTALQDFITVRESLELFARFYTRRRPLDVLISSCALNDFLDRDTRKISGGQRQRLLLAIALVNDPAIVFLDEPTTGLDPQARRRFWDLIERIKGEGKTILLTTHYMEEAYTLCDEIAIMDRGVVVAQGAPRELLARHFDDVVLELPEEDARRLDAVQGMDFVARAGVREIHTGDVEGSVRALLNAGVPLHRLKVRQRTLEDLFLELTGRELRP